MYLCFDVGNTTIEIALCQNKEIIKKTKLDTNTKESKKYYGDFFQSFTNSLLIEGVIISSVVPSIDKLLQEVLTEVYNIRPIVVNNNLKHDINIRIQNPSELGSDLLISSIGAKTKYDGNILIVDLGTANKFLVLRGNDFLGGAIAPGLKSSLNSLFSDAEKLSLVPIETPNKVIGDSTISCIQSGIVYGTVSMIEGMYKKMEQEVGCLKVLVTGGNAPFIIDCLSIEFEYCPDLLIEGLIELYANNK